MLILDRALGRSFKIEGGIQITILSMDRKKGSVRVGIDAPRNILVWREELEPFQTGLRKKPEQNYG